MTPEQLKNVYLDGYVDGSRAQAKLMYNEEEVIGFANWIRVCKLKQRPYDFDNIKELLEIYKKEKGL